MVRLRFGPVSLLRKNSGIPSMTLCRHFAIEPLIYGLLELKEVVSRTYAVRSLLIGACIISQRGKHVRIHGLSSSGNQVRLQVRSSPRLCVFLIGPSIGPQSHSTCATRFCSEVRNCARTPYQIYYIRTWKMLGAICATRS
jgi:hypothetical protein